MAAEAGVAEQQSVGEPGASGSKPGRAAKLAKKDEPAPIPLKPATASREDNLTYDLKRLAAFDISPLDAKVDFLAYTRDSVQLLVNSIFALPRQECDEGALAILPTEEGFRLPRKKPIPKIKAKTRWQKFMEERGMQKRKRSRLVFDEVSGDWKPRWGYKSIKKSQEKADAIHEMKPGENSEANPFLKQSAEKSLQRARQKMREVRNKVEGAGGKLRASVPELDHFKNSKRGKDGLREAVKRAQVSSASFGKFDFRAPNENTGLQTKRQKVHISSPSEEKERYLKTATRLLSGEGGIDKDKMARLGARSEREALGGKGRPKGKKERKRRSKQGGRKRSKG